MKDQRKGIAIVAALGGIVVIGALIAGVFFVSSQESQISQGSLVHERAFRAAELGLNTTLAGWDNVGMYSLPVGGMDTMTYAGTGWVDTVVVTKLTPRAYSLISSATAGTGRLARSRKKTLLSVRLSAPDFDFLGALTVRGTTQIGGSSVINGKNTNPGGWSDCPAANDTLAGVAIADSTQITYSGTAHTVTGSPKILQAASAGDTTKYFEFGDEDWGSLTAAATKVITGTTTFSQINPVVTNGVCDKSVASNWGAPSHTTPANACENYFPIIHHKGTTSTLKLSGNKGQGILLVDGDLEISGGFEFYGPVIVRGRIKTTGTGGKLNGGVMAANVQLDQNTVLGDATIIYSSCAVEKAMAGAANPRRISERAWTEVH
ncbi:MAG TPA: hypothetical protein VMY38_06430 [Gemmatimonadaceae bacterium]|nr:hypothetical protein [Gemmatimonadaceae bacterium]